MISGQVVQALNTNTSVYVKGLEPQARLAITVVAIINGLHANSLLEGKSKMAPDHKINPMVVSYKHCRKFHAFIKKCMTIQLILYNYDRSPYVLIIYLLFHGVALGLQIVTIYGDIIQTAE